MNNNIAKQDENNEMNNEETETVTDSNEMESEELEMSEDSMPEDSMPELTGEETMEELMGIYEESFKRFEEGQVVTGTIIAVDKDHVLVDVGYKSEGQISIHEFRDEEGNVDVKLNDQVEVMVEVWDEEAETVILSKEKAAKVKVWDAIKDIYDEDSTIEGIITSRVKGGFSVDIGLPAFLPGSQADLRPIRNMDEMVGQTYNFKVLKYNRKRSNIPSTVSLSIWAAWMASFISRTSPGDGSSTPLNSFQ